MLTAKKVYIWLDMIEHRSRWARGNCEVLQEYAQANSKELPRRVDPSRNAQTSAERIRRHDFCPWKIPFSSKLRNNILRTVFAGKKRTDIRHFNAAQESLQTNGQRERSYQRSNERRRRNAVSGLGLVETSEQRIWTIALQDGPYSGRYFHPLSLSCVSKELYAGEVIELRGGCWKMDEGGRQIQSWYF